MPRSREPRTDTSPARPARGPDIGNDIARDDALPDGQSRLPIKTIHINRSPVVIGKVATLSEAMAERWGIDRGAWARHADVARLLSGRTTRKRYRAGWLVVLRSNSKAKRIFSGDSHGSALVTP